MSWKVYYIGHFNDNTYLGENAKPLTLEYDGRSSGCPADNGALEIDDNSNSEVRFETVVNWSNATIRITRGSNLPPICSAYLAQINSNMHNVEINDLHPAVNCGILDITTSNVVYVTADDTVYLKGGIGTGEPRPTIKFQIAVKEKYVPSAPNADNTNFGNLSVVTITNANPSHLSALSHRVTWYLGDGSTYSHTETVAAGTTTAQYTIPESWAAFVPNATAATLNIKVETYYNQYKVGGTERNTAVQVYVPSTGNFLPSIGSLTACVNNPKTGLEWVYFYRATGIKVKVNDPVNSVGSTIASYEFSSTFNEVGTWDGTTSTFSVPLMLGIGDCVISIRAVDQRGRKSAPVSITVHVQEFGAPLIQVISAFRCIANGTASENGTYGNGKVVVSPTSIVCNINGVSEYSSNSKYIVGQVIKRNGEPYVCITAINTPETFNSAKWRKCLSLYSASATYAVNALCIYDAKVYRCRIAITTAEAWNSDHWTEELNYLNISSEYHAEGSTTMVTAVESMRSGVAYTFGNGQLLATSTYYFKVTVTDAFSCVTIRDVLIETAAYSIHVKNGGQGVAFGKTCEQNMAVEINPAWALYFRGASVLPVVYSEINPPELYNAQNVSIPLPVGLVWLKRRM